jgi:hypothetical protein
MQYGAHATVITPEELRQVIRGEIEAMQAIYRSEKRGIEDDQ